jgi:hypothetical protein
MLITTDLDYIVLMASKWIQSTDGMMTKRRKAVPWLRRLVAGLSPRRPGFDPGSVHVGFVVDKVALGQVFSPSTSVFPCQFDCTGAPLLVKIKKKLIIFHLSHRVAQEALRLRCVRSICCGALHHKKKKKTELFEIKPAPLLLRRALSAAWIILRWK